MADEKDRSKLSEKQIMNTNLGGKEAKENVKTMTNLISALKENTEEQKKETETASTVLDTSQLLDKLDMSALQKEFQSAKQILENPKASQTEKDLAVEQIETIKANAESEEERREQAKKEDEANSLLMQIANGVDGVAKGLEDFVGNALAAGGLFATALLFIDPEKFFGILNGAIAGVSAIISSIGSFIDGDFSEGFQKLKDNLGAVTGVLVTGVLVFIGPILKLVSGTAKFFKSIVNFFKNFGKNMAKLGKTFKFIGKLIGRIFLPITAVVFAIKGLVKGFQKEGSIGEKIMAGIKEGVGGIFDFLLGIPKWALGKVLDMLGFDSAAASVEGFSFKDLFTADFWMNIGGFISDSFGKMWEGFKTWFSESMSSIGEFFGNAGDFLKDIGNWLHQKVQDVWQSLKDSFSAGLENAGNFIGGIGDAIQNFIKSVLRFVLPDPTKDRGFFDPVNLVVKAIPDSVYEYAGINPDTGELIQAPINTPVATEGDDLIQGSQSAAQGGQGLTQQNLVTQVTTSKPTDNSSRTNVSYTQTPMSPTTGDLQAARR